MNKAKWFGSAVFLLCLLTSCPQDAGRVNLDINNFTDNLNIVYVGAINFTGGGNNYEDVSDNLLDSVIVAGDDRELFVPLRQIADGDGIVVQMSGGALYTASIPGGFTSGMRVGIVMIRNLQGVVELRIS